MTNNGKPFVVPQSVYDRVSDENKAQIDERGQVVSDKDFAEAQVSPVKETVEETDARLVEEEKIAELTEEE